MLIFVASMPLSACTVASVMAPTPMVDVGTSTAAITVPGPDERMIHHRRPPAAPPVDEASAEPADTSSDTPDPLPGTEKAARNNDLGQMDEEQVALALPDPGEKAAPIDNARGTQPDEQSDISLNSEGKPAPRYSAVPPVVPLHPARPAVPERRYAALPPALPGVITPPVEPQVPGLMPATEIELRHELKRLGVTYADMPPIHPGGACGIDYPVKVMALSGDIQMRPAATLNARMAVTFAKYIKNDFAPAIRWRYYSGIRSIRDGSYSCRAMIGESTHHLSEHAKGNAVDLMGVTLDSGRVIDVEKPGWFSFRERGFLNKVRADACGYFTTVLGPGYNWAHHNHFHFDLMQRRNGHIACR